MLKEFTLSTEQRRAFQDLFYKAFQRTGKKQFEVAEEAGVSTHFLSDVLHGPRANMSLFPTLLLACHLGIEPNQLAQVIGYYTPPQEIDYEMRRRCEQLNRLPPEMIPIVDRLLELR